MGDRPRTSPATCRTSIRDPFTQAVLNYRSRKGWKAELAWVVGRDEKELLGFGSFRVVDFEIRRLYKFITTQTFNTSCYSKPHYLRVSLKKKFT